MSFPFYHEIYERIFLKINIIVGFFLEKFFAVFNLKYIQKNGWFSELALKECDFF